MLGFENKDFEGIYYSRFIASYTNIMGRIRRKPFTNWLRQLTINGKKIPENVIEEITFLGETGMCELELNCRHWSV